jgi:hypothetical protein
MTITTKERAMVVVEDCFEEDPSSKILMKVNVTRSGNAFVPTVPYELQQIDIKIFWKQLPSASRSLFPLWLRKQDVITSLQIAIFAENMIRDL